MRNIRRANNVVVPDNREFVREQPVFCLGGYEESSGC
jgi:hypothetical protein